jgi:Glycosyltransferase
MASDTIAYPFDKSVINLVSVAKIIWTKGFDRLIDVHKRLIDEGYKHYINILGIGEDQGKLQKKIEELGLQDSFRFLGFHKNPYKFVSRSDLYICSSLREGFSTAVSEALILGVPVVSTNCSGAEELLGANNEYGIVTENTEEGIYNGLKKLLSNPELLKYYKDKATERGRFFSTEKTVKEVENLLDSLIDG